MTWTEEQEQAIYDSGTNIIVSAGAGSGKTAVLSERVLQKILNGTHVNELLILTFTKAAAEEMKSRIRKKISSNKELSHELTLLDSAYITTFDSYALSVVKKYHYLLNISQNVGITDESIIKIQETKIMDEVFEEFYDKKEENFCSLIKKYCIKNDDFFRYLILGVANSIDSNINGREFIDNIRNNYYEKDSIESIINEYAQVINNKIEYIKDYLTISNNYFEDDYCEKLFLECESILSSDINNLCDFSKVKLSPVPRGSDDEAKEYKAELKNQLDELYDLGKYGNRETIYNDIMSSKNHILCILDIVERYIDKLEEYKKDNQIYTFKDIAFNAIKVVSENEEVRDEIKYSFKEIMIDEYQDTNDIQDKFIKLIENNNVYMVGDIKQSIYRFNGSNPSIFKEKYDNYSKGNNGRKIDLIDNFRSREEVLKGINELFSLIMDNEIGGAEYHESHKMKYGNSSYTKLRSNIDYDMEIVEYEVDESKNYSNYEIEIFAIAKDIKNKINNNLQVFDKETSQLRKATYSDFVIILDRSKYFDDYKKIFEYEQIPLSILKNDKLTTGTDINLIRNIIDFIIKIHEENYDIDFKYDFISIARSFLYEYKDNEIFEIFTNDSYKDTKVYKDFSNIESISSITCGELFLKVLDITDFYNKLYKIGDYDEINIRISTIYDLATQFNNLGYSIYEFRDYLDNVIKEGIDIQYEKRLGNVDSVKIMTIHKSKGLEYPICYFADLDHNYNLSDVKSKILVDKKYGIMIPSESENTNSSVVKDLFMNEFLKEEISEKIRLLYVALTRAREKIIIYLPKKETKSCSKKINGTFEDEKRMKFMRLSEMVYSCIEDLNKYLSFIEMKDLDLTKNYLFKKSRKNIECHDCEKLDVKEINIESEEVINKHFSHENKNIINKEIHDNLEFGTKVHEVLELIDFKNYNPNIIKNEFIRNKVTKFLNNDLLVNVKEAEIYHEYEFSYVKDNTEYHGIIDLMLEYNDHIDIIDYKLKDISSEDYKKQLQGYKEYINSVSNKKVNTYLYSIIEENFNEVKI